MKTFHLLLVMLITMFAHSASTHANYNIESSYKPIIVDVADCIEVADSQSFDDNDKDISVSFTHTFDYLAAKQQTLGTQITLLRKLAHNAVAIRAPPSFT